MASNLTIDTDNIVTFSDTSADAATDLNSTFTEVVTATNTFMEDHAHNGTDSSSVSVGIGSLTTLELVVGQIMGGYA